MPAPLMTEIEAKPADFRRVLVSIAVYVAAVLAILPFVTAQWLPFPPVVTIYTTWIVLVDIATVAVIGGHLRRQENAPLLLLACAYLYSALMGAAHILTFPGAILRDVPVIGGGQLTSYIYNGWKLGFALLVLASVLVPQQRPLPTGRPPRIYISLVAALVVLLVGLGLAIEGKLPVLVVSTGFTLVDIVLSFTAFVVGLLVIVLLLSNDIDNLLKLWLAAAMTIFCGDLLVSTLGGGRFTLGWYFGRTSGLISSCTLFLFFVLRFMQQIKADEAH